MSFKLKISSTKRPNKTPRNDVVSHPTPPSYSAEIIGSNDDLLNQILLRLPIKSLLKFKSVSKHWLSLISNPNFSRCRSSSVPSAASGLFFRGFGSGVNNPEFYFLDFDQPSRNPFSSSFTAPFRSLNFVNELSRITIKQSCNGLLLCCSYLTSRKNYYVYNPTTKQYTTLPPLPFRRGTAVLDIVLAFDPSKSPHYKVICVMNGSFDTPSDPCPYRIMIYSSEAGPWRLYGLPSSFSDFDWGLVRGVFWNGAVNWFNGWGTSLYFKVVEEHLCQMPITPEAQDYINGNNGRGFKYFGETGDHFHFVEYINEPGVTYLNVFELEKDYTRWVLKFQVDLVEISNVFPEIISDHDDQEEDMKEYIFYVVCIVRGDLDEDSYLLLNIPDKVLRYNFKSKTFYKLFEIEDGLMFLNVTEVYEYNESLACV